jgi:hypothetical protein
MAFHRHCRCTIAAKRERYAPGNGDISALPRRQHLVPLPVAPATIVLPQCSDCLELLERLVAIVAIIDGAAEGRAEGVFQRGMLRTAVRAGGRDG